MELHIIQRQILQELIHGKHRFSELQPDGVENNLYQYHLQRLIGSKIVAKADDGYTLTPMGYQIAAQWSTDLQSVRLQPVVVVMNLIFNQKGEVLVVERHKEPFINTLSPPFGKVHYEESLAEAAVRDLHEKTGITNVSLQPIGVIELRTDGMHTIAHVFRGNSESGDYIPPDLLLANPDALPGLEALEPLFVE